MVVTGFVIVPSIGFYRFVIRWSMCLHCFLHGFAIGMFKMVVVCLYLRL